MSGILVRMKYYIQMKSGRTNKGVARYVGCKRKTGLFLNYLIILFFSN
jgi:hypothetical protein